MIYRARIYRNPTPVGTGLTMCGSKWSWTLDRVLPHDRDAILSRVAHGDTDTRWGARRRIKQEIRIDERAAVAPVITDDYTIEAP